MSRNKIISMLSDIISEVDYDVYEGIFSNPEEQEVADEIIENMIVIVKKHIK
jgi:hypothetical protein